jgi:hypothetical protein
VALRHDEYTSAGAVVATIDIDSPGRHAAMIEKLNLPYPMLSDPDRDLAIAPYDLKNTSDPRNLAIPATIVIDPSGDEALRLVSRDFADRPFENQALELIRRLNLEPVSQSVPTPGTPEPGPGAMPFGELRTYFRGAKFGAVALGLRSGATDEARAFGELVDHYMEDVTTMYRRMRDGDPS